MTSEPKNSSWLQRFVESNLMALICGGAVIWAGYNSSSAVTAEKLAQHDRQLELIGTELREIRNSLHNGANCAARR
jgi:hypothetical protein